MKAQTGEIHRALPDAPTSAALRRELKDELTAAGCFAPAPMRQVLHMIGVLLVYGFAYALLLTAPETLARILLLAVIAMVSVQAGYIAHEAGHRAITRKRWLAVSIGQVYNTLLTALCYSHFQKIHVCHHSHCNDQDRDIDMQSELFSLYPDAKFSKKGLLGRFVTRHQAWLIWPLVTLQGFSLKFDSLVTLYRNPHETRVDQLLLLLHLGLWLGIPTLYIGFGAAALNYFLLTWFIGPYLGSVFLVNHIGTEVVQQEDGTPGFIQRLTTTRNLGSSRLANLFFGGMNNHIEHHLFPSIPTTNLHRARPIVEQFCQRHNLSYRKTSWGKALQEVFHYLRQISRQPLPSTAGIRISGGTQHE